MMQVPPKWRVTVTIAGKPSVVFRVHDNCLSNVQALVAKLDFDGATGVSVDAADRPTNVTVSVVSGCCKCGSTAADGWVPDPWSIT